MTDTLKEIFNKITANNTEQDIHNEVDNAKSEYVYDWEDEFDSLDDAYEEQGRGEAESLVLNNLITQYTCDLSSDDRSILFNQLAEHYYLNTN